MSYEQHFNDDLKVNYFPQPINTTYLINGV